MTFRNFATPGEIKNVNNNNLRSKCQILRKEMIMAL